MGGTVLDHGALYVMIQKLACVTLNFLQQELPLLLLWLPISCAVLSVSLSLFWSLQSWLISLLAVLGSNDACTSTHVLLAFGWLSTIIRMSFALPDVNGN